MSVIIRAHYDGVSIVPDEPVDLPVDQPLEAELRPLTDSRAASEEAVQAIQRFLRRAVAGLNIPDEALRRENLYEDRQ